MLEITKNRNILIENQEAQILYKQLEEAFIKICAAEMNLGSHMYSSEYIKKHYKQMWELFCILGDN